MTSELLDLIFVVLLGLSTGSFVTALAYRLPRGLPYSVDANRRPIRSICPPCGKQLRVWELIPVLSWLRQGGRCACGRTTIPMRYPLIELGTLAYAFALYKTQGFDLQDIPTYFLMTYAITFFVIACEGNNWNRIIFLYLFANTIISLIAKWLFTGANLIPDSILILSGLLILFGLQRTTKVNWGRNQAVRIATSALFLLWLLFFPVL